MDRDEAISQMTEHLEDKCGDTPVTAITILARGDGKRDVYGLTAHYSLLREKLWDYENGRK